MIYLSILISLLAYYYSLYSEITVVAVVVVIIITIIPLLRTTRSTFIVSDTLTVNGKFHSVANGNLKLIIVFNALLVSVRVQFSICKI